MWRTSGETEKKCEKREKGVKKEPFELVGEIFSPSGGVEALNVENTTLVGHLRSSGWKRCPGSNKFGSYRIGVCKPRRLWQHNSPLRIALTSRLPISFL